MGSPWSTWPSGRHDSGIIFQRHSLVQLQRSWLASSSDPPCSGPTEHTFQNPPCLFHCCAAGHLFHLPRSLYHFCLSKYYPSFKAWVWWHLPNKAASTPQAGNNLFFEFEQQIILCIHHNTCLALFCVLMICVTYLPSYAINISGQELCTSHFCSTTNQNTYLAHTRPSGNARQRNKWTAWININYCFVYWSSPKSIVLLFLYHWWLSTYYII